MSYDHYYADPTGNITILVETKAALEDRLRLSKEFFEKIPECEQVGFVSFDAKDADIRLDMAGGEFCGNATMSAGALFAFLNSREEECLVRVSSSGVKETVRVKVKRLGEALYRGVVEMPDPEGYEDIELKHRGRSYSFSMVKFPGMYHLISEEPMEREMAEEAIKEWCKKLSCPALGIMMMDIKEKRLTPLVYVEAVDSLYWENSCASGTSATGYHLYRRYKKAVDVDFKEPGGILKIKTDEHGKLFLTGTVKLRSQKPDK
ncbi:MAG: hypothetical protein K5931_02215 [Lachnospiraceae bacterium]|nr:hypothetical protein [Lachnospiraceae bacterium]